MQQHERYERLLRRAKTEDLSEVSGIGCLYQSGVDKLGRPVVVFIGKWFSFNEIDLDKVKLGRLLPTVNVLLNCFCVTGAALFDIAAGSAGQRRLHHLVLPHADREQ